MKRAVVAGVGAAAVVLLATGCSSEGIYAIPLPGGAGLGDHPNHLTVQFDDVLDLVPQSAVKVDGVPVGRVESIGVAKDGWTASVGLVVNSSAKLPANAIASVQQTSLLGEKFIELAAPPEGATGTLADGATITADRTRHATDIEEVLGALSLLLNGGGVAELQPIIHELTTALGGRENNVRGLLEQADSLINGLNQQRDDITRALDGLDTLTSRVNDQSDKIGKILTDIPPAVQVLEEQRPQLTQMLGQLDRLGSVGTDVLTKSKDNLISDLRALRPTLQALSDSSKDLVSVLPLVPTFPFPDGVEKVIHGNSLNLFITVDGQIGDQLSALGVGQPDPVYRAPKFGSPLPTVDPSNPYVNGNGPAPGWPTVSALPLPPIVPRPAAGAASPAPNPIGGLLNQLGVGGR
ncbi:MCE family protein [Antrihabitans cavernicola]|uniref:MCE family protein n=1 Tax=Antrihabitans cavernicola TaxID=2495913 RepID=A0A5A7S482_9NOCA|nr:MCE family protein [Spelaeibacter cavernicola]KAA0020209.1 MCE family protein [Spelaeibacter cavernicola]